MTNLAEKGLAAAVLLLAAVASGSACAMRPTSSDQLRCVVQGAEKLPPELGGAAAVCAAFERAAAPELRRAGIALAGVSVSVQVRSQYRISAVASVGERSLPEQNVGISDRQLNTGAIEMLARAIVADLSNIK